MNQKVRTKTVEWMTGRLLLLGVRIRDPYDVNLTYGVKQEIIDRREVLT